MANTYTSDSNENIIKIYINNVLHFTIDKHKILSIQSWVEHKPFWVVIGKFFYSLILERKIDVWIKSYKIEFTLLDSESTYLEYDDKFKWREILFLIDKEF